MVYTHNSHNLWFTAYPMFFFSPKNLRPGGYFVLEPQEWGSYKKSHGTGDHRRVGPCGVVVVIKRDFLFGMKGYNHNEKCLNHADMFL